MAAHLSELHALAAELFNSDLHNHGVEAECTSDCRGFNPHAPHPLDVAADRLALQNAAPRLLKCLQDLLLSVDSHSHACECAQCEAESAAKRLLEELGEEVS